MAATWAQCPIDTLGKKKLTVGTVMSVEERGKEWERAMCGGWAR